MSQSKIKNPHDSLFKASLKYPQVAREFLALYLPDEIKKYLDFNQINYCPTQFINAQLRRSESDVLFKVKLASQMSYIYILAEQQTTVDKLMPLRLLHYMTCIWNDHCKQKGRKDALPLPLIFPLVFFTGPSPYHGMRTIWELCGEKASAMQQIMHSPFHLIDVGLFPDEKLTAHIWAGTLGFILREQFKKDMASGMKKIAANLTKIGLETQGQYLLELYSYLISIKLKEGPLGLDKLRTIVHEQLEVEKNMMSIADLYRQEGEEIGRAKGERKGKLEGKLESKLEIAKEMLDAGYDKAFIVKITHLPLEMVKNLQEQKSTEE